MLKLYRIVMAVVLFAIIIPLFNKSTFAFANPVDVTTQHNDNSRTGANLLETSLNTSNVNKEHFGKLFTKPVDGQIYAQPLYLSNMNIGGKVRNVIYVATMHNTLYCFDADDPSLQPLWTLGVGSSDVEHPSVPLPDPNIGWGYAYKDIFHEIGVLSTPVIDKVSNTIYLVAMTLEDGKYQYKLHAIDIVTGKEKSNSPQLIKADYPGTEKDKDGIITNHTWNFKENWQSQRSALTLANGRVYFGSASYGDAGVYFGWLFGYNAQTLAQEVVYNTTPSGVDITTAGTQGGQGGIWMSGQGLTVDNDGSLYFTTGNGLTDVDKGPNQDGGPNRAASYVKLSKDPGVPAQVLDWFTPYNYEYTDDMDLDLGSTGLLLIPNTNLLVGGSKEGTLYVVDSHNMGHFHPGDDSQIVQSIVKATEPHVPGSMMEYSNIHGTPVYWEGPQGKWIYLWGEEDYFKAFNFNGTKLDPTAVSQSSITAGNGMPGGFISISADGNKAGTGIAWVNMPISDDANHNTVAGVLRAFNASNLKEELWNSEQMPSRDKLGKFAKFTSPTVANGKVYMASFSDPNRSDGLGGSLVVYGLYDAKLKSLTMDGIPLTPGFSPEVPDYTANVPYAASSTKVNAMVEDLSSSYVISGNGKEYTANDSIPLIVGDNLIQVEVTAADGITKQVYTVHVNVAPPSGNATLKDIKLVGNTGEILLNQGVRDNVYAYQAYVPYNVDSASVTVELMDPKATYAVQGVRQSGSFPFAFGNNDIIIEVTAENGHTQTYTVTIVRDSGYNASLTDLKLSGGITLDQTVTSTVYNYTATVPNSVSVTTVTYSTYDSLSSVGLQLNNQTYTVGSSLPLNVGSNNLKVTVTSPNGKTTQTYLVTINRQNVVCNCVGGGGGGGGGSPDNNQSSTKEVKLNLDKVAKITNETTSDGQSSTKIAVDGSNLLKEIGSYTKVEDITIEIPGNNPVTQIVIPTSALKELAGKLPNVVLQMKGASVAYNLPLKALRDLPQDKMATITIAKVSSKLYNDIKAVANREGFRLLTNPVAFNIDIDGQEVTDFQGVYVNSKISVIGAVAPYSSTAVWIDDDNKMKFIPSVFTGGDGKAEVHIFSPHNSIFAVVQGGRTFADLRGHWSETDVQMLTNKLIVSGASDNSFAPDNKITRAEFAALLVRALGLTDTAPSVKFNDVNSTDWFAGAVGAAYQAGLIAGFEDQTFKPNDTITREQMVSMIGRALKLGGKDVNVDLKLLDTFDDKTVISDWAQGAAVQALNAKIIQGTTDHTFDAKENATRAQAAVMLKRMLQYLQFIN